MTARTSRPNVEQMLVSKHAPRLAVQWRAIDTSQCWVTASLRRPTKLIAEVRQALPLHGRVEGSSAADRATTTAAAPHARQKVAPPPRPKRQGQSNAAAELVVRISVSEASASAEPKTQAEGSLLASRHIRFEAPDEPLRTFGRRTEAQMFPENSAESHGWARQAQHV